MKRLLCLLLTLSLLATSIAVSAQVIIEIEKLSKPKELLPVSSTNEIAEDLVLEDAQLYLSMMDRMKTTYDYNVLSVNVDAERLVSYGFHSFFYGMYEAYANHRPFVLSPDMVWMLIAQGFSHHINANPEKYRDKMVDFSGKMSLVVESEKPLDSAQWDVLIPRFAEEIRENTKGTIAETMIADFSTTTQYEQIASEITLMETTKAYFEFVLVYAVCGIPEVTLLGTPEDWQKVYDKTMQLRSYDLAWWIDDLRPILKKFIDASKGKKDVKFWRKMFKWHTQKEYGAPNIIDGWIVKFFPYDKDGKRFNLRTLTRDSNLPDEISKADVRFIEVLEDGSKVETMIELWGGFFGLEQNRESFALTPKIGWMVKKQDDSFVVENVKKQMSYSGLEMKVKEVPAVLNKLDSIPSLTLYFDDEVVFPEWMKTKKIKYLYVEGKISDEEKDKILGWYPNTEIVLHRKGKRDVRRKPNMVNTEEWIKHLPAQQPMPQLLDEKRKQ